MSELEYRRPSADEVDKFLRVSIRSYGSDDSPDRVAWECQSNEADRSFGVLDNGRWVAGSGAFSFQVTLPGGAIVPAAGVTMIGVEPTHRRRGILTTMLRRLHDDAIERDEPIALLTASETSIYRRFGYGMSAEVAHLAIAADKVRFEPPLDDAGSFEMVDPRLGTDELAAVHDLVRRSRDGWLDLSDAMWTQIRDDPAFIHEGRTPLRAVVHHDHHGQADGYATWRIEARRDPDRLAGNRLFVEHLTGATPDVEAALWAFVASIDLVTEVRWENGPVDPQVRWRLAEPRQLRTLARADMVWARLLDVATVLSARTYGAHGSLVLEVSDRFHPERGGRFSLKCSSRGATGRCERIGGNVSSDSSTNQPPGNGPADAPTLALDTADLASLTMGAVSPSQLADAGRINGAHDAIEMADALFTLPRRPHWPIEF